VPVGHEQNGVVANAVAALLGGFEQPFDVRDTQKVFAALIRH
jgi:hypothetical protein